MLILIPCPECGVPAEVTDRFSLTGTDGPVEHHHRHGWHRRRRGAGLVKASKVKCQSMATRLDLAGTRPARKGEPDEVQQMEPGGGPGACGAVCAY